MIRRLALSLAVTALALIAWAYRTAISDPVVRHAELALLPADGARETLRILLLSDIHVSGPDMPPKRLMRIVQQANALKPDIVLIAGDFVSDKKVASKTYTLDEAVAPLRDLRSPLGTFAVLGNHDHWRDAEAARRALKAAGIHLLDNQAERAGPLAIGGVDDAFTGHDDLRTTITAMSAIGGVPILLSHSPDPFPRVPTTVKLMVAGHTHCGQIRLPFIGAVSTMSAYGERYACGLVAENKKTLIVTAGLGTSILPFRLGAVPDMWVIEIKKPRV